jgi:hypothetical protein
VPIGDRDRHVGDRLAMSALNYLNYLLSHEIDPSAPTVLSYRVSFWSIKPGGDLANCGSK